MTRRFIMLFFCGVLGIGTFVPQRTATAQASFDATNAQRATVAITQMTRSASNQPIISCVGSGTLVSADGLILTNAHIALGNTRCKTDTLVIGLTTKLGEPPVATYYADVLESNVGYDLAVIRITRSLDGRPIDRAALALPFVELGDSEALNLDDTISVVGYTNSDEKNSGAAAVRRGTVSNFLEEARVGSRAWIKTNAVIPGRMSGGGAYNNVGQLIGVPTIEPLPSGTEACRIVQDTNNDGRIDAKDTCIPSGGYINALRPSRLARGLVRAAQLGITVGGSNAPNIPPKPKDPPAFSRLFLSPGVSSAGMPSTVTTAMPSGTKSLYLFFDYSNMVDGMVYELRTTIDGVPNATFSLAPTTWSGGERGLWYVGSREQVWPNGQYVFTLLVEGVMAGSQQISIGGPAQAAATFSDILFGVADPKRQLIATGNVLPAGDEITAEFVFNNVTSGTQWRQQWFYEGVQITPQSPAIWTDKDGTSGKRRVSAASTPANPLQSGRYRLELYLADQLAATADFVMAGKQVIDRVNIFDNLSFASKVTDDNPTDPGTTFSNAIPQLYATFGWNEVAEGTPWTWRWAVDGNPLFEGTQPWQAAVGSLFWLRINGTGHLPDGSYSLELLVGGVSMGKATAKVGLGQLPVNTFATSSGIQVQGRVTDAETGKGIPGVMFIVLRGDVASKEFTWRMTEVDAISISDSQGDFQLSQLLPRGSSYNLIVVARGYLPLSSDGLKLDDKVKSPLVLNIELNKD